jgi:AcrR family transcriptional regulator
MVEKKARGKPNSKARGGKSSPLKGALTARSPIRRAMEEKILVAAIDVLHLEGLAAFSLRRVAAATEIRLSTLQYHFPTFDDLLSATVKRYMDGFLREMDDIVLTPSKSPEEKIRNLIDSLIKLIRVSGTSRMSIEVWAIAQRNESACKIITAGYEVYRKIFQKAIEQIKSGLDSAELQARATLIGAMIDGLLFYTFEGSPKVRDWDAITRLCTESALFLCRQ